MSNANADPRTTLRTAMDAAHITDPIMRAGIPAIAFGENGSFAPHTEMGYAHTANARIRQIFGQRVASLTDAELGALKADDRAFFNRIYGGRFGNRPGTDDGFNFRGRGPFQLTFRGNYERYGALAGVDLISDPDLANDAVLGPKVAIAYILDRYHPVAGDTDDEAFERMKRAVGNAVASTEAVKDQLFAQYLASSEFAVAEPPLSPST